MINIVFFVTALDSGGLENYLLRFLQEKHLKFNDIYVWCKSGRAGQLESEFLQLNNVEIITKSLSYFGNRGLREVEVFIKRNNITAVCDFTGNFAGRVLKIAKRANVSKRVAMYRGSTDHFKNDFLRNTYNNWVKGLTYKYATDILANSKAAFNYFYPKIWEIESGFKVIYNGVNASNFINETNSLRTELNIPNDAFVVGHTGRYNEAKNHKTIIEVAEQLIKKYNDIYFVLCGNGVKENLYAGLIKKGLTNRILVFNNRTDIPTFLNTMDCYFFPSITEGQPNALIEAMIAELPIVASNIEPIKEATPVAAHAYLKDPYDAVGFVHLIENIYKSKSFASSLIYQDWAIKSFDSKERFEEFYKVLYK